MLIVMRAAIVMASGVWQDRVPVPPWGEVEEGEQTTTVSSVEVGNEEDQQDEVEVAGRRRGGGVGI